MMLKASNVYRKPDTKSDTMPKVSNYFCLDNLLTKGKYQFSEIPGNVAGKVL